MAKRLDRSGHRGVQVRENGAVRIRIKVSGQWTWKTLPGISGTVTGQKTAARIRQQILDDDRLGVLDLSEYFDDIQSPEADSLRFDSFAEKWLRYRSADCSPSTLRGYRIRLDGIWIPAFGGKRIDTVRRSDILDVVVHHGWTSGKTLSNALTPVRGVFDLAIDDEIITRNPAARIKGPKSQKQEISPLSRAEMDAVLDNMSPGWLPYFQIAFGSGMRTSELIALQWPDIDIKAKKIRVHHARVYKVDRQQTKTATERTIPITPLAMRGIKAQQSRTRFAGPDVFLHPSTGKPIADDLAPRRAWNTAIARAGIPHRKSYSTRHTHATLNLMAGVSLLQVALWLGHSSPKTTLENYAKWIPGDDEPDAIDALK